MGHRHDHDRFGYRKAQSPSSWPSTIARPPAWGCTPPNEARASKRCNRSAKGCAERFGAIGEGRASGLTLRHDNGSQYVSHDFQDEIRWLGIDSSPSFVRSPEGNGCAERFIRTLKENLLWLKTYSCIDDLQRDLQRFKEKYNEQWLIERHGHRSPSQFTSDEMGEIPIAA